MLFVETRGQTEISQLYVATTIKQDVVGFDVALYCQ